MIKIPVDPRAKGLIFDLDGTLIDTMPIHFQAFCEACAPDGFAFPEDVFYELAGIPTKQSIYIINERFGCNLNAEKITQLKEEFYISRITGAKPVQPVFDIVQEYYGKLPMALGTGGTRDIAMMNVRAIGLEKYFDIIITADDVLHHKPHPETFLKGAELMGVDPQFCQVFEDANPGLQAAKSAGMIATDIRLYLNGKKII